MVEAGVVGVQVSDAGVVDVQMLGTMPELSEKYRLANMRSGKNLVGNIYAVLSSVTALRLPELSTVATIRFLVSASSRMETVVVAAPESLP